MKEEGRKMNREYTAATKKDGDWWVGWIEEVPGVNCQERSHEELLDSLKVTLKEALEFNREDAISAAGTDFREERIAI
jgi:predicted RNase H-like HicB family nuclease